MHDGHREMNDLAALERFVVDNDDLLKLEETIGTFNVFDALRIERREIRHSNFLAWLLDPGESHGQGDLFLKPLLMAVLRRTPANQRPLGPIDLDGVDLVDIEIRREWRNIDLLIVSRKPNFIVAIENKVDAGEHRNQLQRYEDVVRKEFPHEPKLFVFLTPDGEAASDSDWVPIGYDSIYQVLTRVRGASKGSLGVDVAVFLDHYLNLIGSRFMENADVARLCKQIYANHRRALLLIFEHVGTAASGVNAAVERFFAERPKRWTVLHVKGKMVYFVPNEWVGKVCTASGDPAFGVPARVFMETSAKDRSLHVRWVVGPGPDPARRKALIEHLLATELLGLAPQRKQLTDTWKRVWAHRALEWDDEQPPDDDAVANALTSLLAGVERQLMALPSAIESLQA